MRTDRRPAPVREHHLRRGAAAAELAVLLPVMAFTLVAATDFARLCRVYAIVTWAARDGALYGSANTANSTNTSGIQSAALADAGDLNPSPTITSTTGTDTDSKGNKYTYVQVTATYTFTTFAQIPGIPSTLNLTRTVWMQVLP